MHRYKNGTDEIEGSKIETSSTVANGIFKTTLNISSPSISDAVSYTCEFTYTDGTKESSSTLLRYRKIITTDKSPYYSHDNDMLRLTCTLESGLNDLPTAVSWKFPNNSLWEDSTMKRVSILELKQPLSGEYKCQYDFSDAQLEVGSYPNVKVALIEIIEKGKRFVTTGNTDDDAPTLGLTCRVMSEDEKDLKWYAGDEAINGSATTYDNGYTVSKVNLTIKSIEDANTYRCNISQTAYSEDEVIVFVFTGRAEFGSETFESVGKTTTLTCMADIRSDIKDPEIRWYKNGMEPMSSTSENRIKNNTELIAEFDIAIGEETAGNYSCKINYTDFDASVILVHSTEVIQQGRIFFFILLIFSVSIYLLFFLCLQLTPDQSIYPSAKVK